MVMMIGEMNSAISHGMMPTLVLLNCFLNHLWVNLVETGLPLFEYWFEFV
jgi:hypothetical protein